MSKLCVVAVFDSAAMAFMNPFYVAARGQAVRSFKDEVNRSADGNVMNRHASDFSLMLLGEFDPNNGRFHLLEDPEVLIRGKDCLVTVS